MLYVRCVELAKNISYSIKLPFFTSNKEKHPGKTKSYEPKALNETMLPMRRKKSITISHTQQRTTPISTPFQPKRKNGKVRKNRRPTLEARKSKQKKYRRKVKRKQNN